MIEEAPKLPHTFPEATQAPLFGEPLVAPCDGLADIPAQMSSHISRITLHISHGTQPTPQCGRTLSDPVIIPDDEDERHDYPHTLPPGRNASDPMLISDDEDEQLTSLSESPLTISLPVGNGTSATTRPQPNSIPRGSESPGPINPRGQALNPTRDSPVPDQPVQAPDRTQAPAANIPLAPLPPIRSLCIHNMHSDAACVYEAYAPSRKLLSAIHGAIDRRKPHPFCITGIPFTYHYDTLVQNIHVLKMRVACRGRVHSHISTPRCKRHPVNRTWPLIKIVAATTVHNVAMCIKKPGPYHAHHMSSLIPSALHRPSPRRQ